MFPWWAYLVIFGGIALILLILFIILVPVKLWFRALVSGAYVGMWNLIGMNIRKVKTAMIVDAYITARKANLRSITVRGLEAHYMSGGRIDIIVQALIAAYNAKIPLSVEAAKAIDLSGRNVLEAIQHSVRPRVIETPPISAVSKDGIELIVKVRITMRTNISRLLGGAGEETIIARVGEGIVTAVGGMNSYTNVLENPDIISKRVQSKGLDTATAYEILSIDIADIDVGENIGAKLKTAEAEANKIIARSKAEEKRAMAIAAEQEARAETQRRRADLLAAESDVPKAMAQAFRTGKMSIMDYQRLQNIAADTKMRSALGNDKDEDTFGGTSGGSNKRPF